MTKTSMLAPLMLLAAGSSAVWATPQPDGTITLEVDLREAGRQLFHGHEVMPVKPGPLTLYYPKWIPGEHSPSGPLENLAGLKITGAGKPLAWRREGHLVAPVHCQEGRDVELLAGARPAAPARLQQVAVALAVGVVHLGDDAGQ